MNVLLIGGTGLISTGIIKHLLARNNPAEFETVLKDKRFDVVIDMICFTPEQAAASIRAFGAHCEHFIFCSTVCTYGIKIPPGVLINETFLQEPISTYGKNKVLCEQAFMTAHDQEKFKVTIIRPSHTYGPGSSLIDNLEPDPPTWDRIERGLPVLCGGDGRGLWVSTHRDDCGKLFAYAALNSKTYGQSYNATRDHVFTWQDFYRQGAAALGKKAHVLFMPTDWITKHDPSRFNLLKEITAFHGPYDSSKARRDVPEFRCEIDFPTGAKETIADVKRRNAWKSSDGDSLYQSMVDKALAIGIEPVTL